MDLQDRWGEDKISCGYKGRFQPVGFLALFLLIFLFLSSVGSAEEKWINYTNASVVYALAFEGDYVWEGTWGGVIKRSLTNPEEDVTYYTRADGLAGNCVYAIAIDPRGVKWFGTNNGVSKFDGVNWVTYNTLNSGLIDNRVTAIGIDSLGGIWFGTKNGLTRFRYDYCHWDFSLEGIGISVISVDSQGNVWVGTRSWCEDYQLPKGIYKFSPPFYDEGINYNKSNSDLLDNSIGAIAFDSQGNVWIANDWGPDWSTERSGISKFDGENWEVFTYENSGLSSRTIESLAIDSEDNKWIATNGKGIFKYDGATWVNYDTSNSSLVVNFVDNIYVDSQERIWFTFKYDPGIGSFDGSNWYNYESSNSALPSNVIGAIAFDPSGNAWLATDRRGWGYYDCIIMCFDGTDWFTYNESNTGIQFHTIRDLAFDKQGNLWVAEGWVHKFDGTHWTTYDTSNSGISGNVEAIAIDIDGTKWFISSYDAVISFDDSTWTVYTAANSGLVHERVTAIAIDSKGNKWIGGRPYYGRGGGVCRFDGTEWTTYNTSNSGLIDDWVRSIQIDSRDNIWIGTDKGLSKFDGNQWTNYDMFNSGLPSNNIIALFVDSQDYLWVATTSSGPIGPPHFYWLGSFLAVSVFDGINWHTYDVTNSRIPNFAVSEMAEDSQGNIWFVGEGNRQGGISILKRSSSRVGQELHVVNLPEEFLLAQNYPNPFNVSTTISYQIPVGISGSQVKLRIFNVSGQLVRTLVDGTSEPGAYWVTWDGRDDRGRAVASGVYFYRLEAEGELVEVKKMILLQ
mgnify:CR=1 FL=1